MIVSGKYELCELIAEGGVRSFRARHKALGHELMVHFVVGGGRQENLALLERLARLPDAKRKLFIDAGEHESQPYLVSWPLPGFRDLGGWLDAAMTPQSAAAVAAPPKRVAAAHSDESEFSRLFFAGVQEPAAAPAAERTKGEFTKLFGGSPSRPEEVPAEPRKAAPAPPPRAAETSGEFTRMFKTGDSPHAIPETPSTPPPPARAQPTPDTGEFDRFFEPSGAAPTPPAAPSPSFPGPPASPAPAPPPQWRLPGPQAGGPGELTRFFQGSDLPLGGSPSVPRRPAAETPLPASPGGATGVFSGPAAAPPTPVAVPPAPAGPGEYTRVFRTAAPPPLVTPMPALPRAKPPETSARPVPEPTPMWFWGGLVVLFVLAVALVLYFALRR